MDRKRARDMMAATNTLDEFAKVCGKRSSVDTLHLPFVSSEGVVTGHAPGGIDV